MSSVTGGFFQLSSAPGTPITTFTSADVAGSLVQFVDDGNEVAPAFSVTLNDGTDDSNTLAATITYNPVNDAPVVTSAALTVNEGQTVTLSAANFGITDPDSAAFTYTVSGVTGGFFQLSSASGTPITTFTSADLSGGVVQFVDNDNEIAPTFSVKVNDGTRFQHARRDDHLQPGERRAGHHECIAHRERRRDGHALGCEFRRDRFRQRRLHLHGERRHGRVLRALTGRGASDTSFTRREPLRGLVHFVDDGDEVAPAFSVTVNDGTDDSNTLAATITYNPVNDAPALTAPR